MQPTAATPDPWAARVSPESSFESPRTLQQTASPRPPSEKSTPKLSGRRFTGSPKQSPFGSKVPTPVDPTDGQQVRLLQALGAVLSDQLEPMNRTSSISQGPVSRNTRLIGNCCRLRNVLRSSQTLREASISYWIMKRVRAGGDSELRQAGENRESMTGGQSNITRKRKMTKRTKEIHRKDLGIDTLYWK